MPAAIDFKAVFDRSPNPYMLLDRELRYVDANPAYLRAVGVRLEDLLGRYILDVFPHDPHDPHNERAAQLRASFERVLETGAPDVLALIPYRVPRQTPDGPVLEERYWSATHTPIPDASGEVAYILQHTVDVTELQHFKQAALALEAGNSEGAREQIEAAVFGRARRVQEANLLLDAERRHLRSLFEQAPGFVCFLRGPDHLFELANAAYYQLVGHREIIGRPVREALPDIAGQGYFELLDRVYASGDPFVGRGLRVFLQRTPGAVPDARYVDLVYQPIFDPGGKVTGIFVQGHDITEQKLLEAEREALLARERVAREETEAAEREQRFLAEAIPQQVWTARPDGTLDFVNQRVVDYFGEAREQILGHGWQTVVHPDDLDACLERWAESLRTGEIYEVNFRLRRADGAWRWHLGRALALCDDWGEVAKWFGTNTDIDEATRARDELRKQTEFEQQLIGIVSHDLRNPLGAIGMAAALLLRRGGLDAQQATAVARIASSSDRAARLIRDFLDFTQARSAGRIPIEPRPANLRDTIRHVVDEVHLTYPERQATVHHSGEEQGQWDPDRIAQVVGNLVGNAFQHSPPDAPVRVISRGNHLQVWIEVQNDGPPIPAATLERLFEPFQRGPDARATSGRSIGLGLYISRQIVQAHGGTIEVRSSAREGTCFRVVLPREVPAREAAVAEL